MLLGISNDNGGRRRIYYHTKSLRKLPAILLVPLTIVDFFLSSIESSSVRFIGKLALSIRLVHQIFDEGRDELSFKIVRSGRMLDF